MTYIDDIAALGACDPALRWLRAEQHLTLADAWAACPDADWLLWYAGRLAGPPGDASRILLVLAACDCAETVLHLVPAGDDRPRLAIETARAWTRGEATLDDVRRVALDARRTHNTYAAWMGHTPDAATFCRVFRDLHGLASDADPSVFRIEFRRLP